MKIYCPLIEIYLNYQINFFFPIKLENIEGITKMNKKEKCSHCGSQDFNVEGLFNDTVYIVCESCRTGYFRGMTNSNQNIALF